ncbi:MAG: hypothetical protein IJC88_04540, partial [Oscillospiraceae bacterium]|nr:hypothetical protein [Oscillospiraceae bacterium]
MKRRFISIFLVLVMGVQLLSVSLTAHAEPLVSEILTNGIINTIYLTEVGLYSKLTPEEKELLQESQQISNADFVTCERLGYNILESIRIARAAASLDLTPAEYQQFIVAYEDEATANSQLYLLQLHKDRFAAEDLKQIIALMLRGESFVVADRTVSSYEFASDTLTLHTTNIPSNTMQSNSSDTDSREKPSQIGGDLISAPTSYDVKNNELVSASSGTLSYRQTIVDIPGRNGMDLKLDLLFTGNSNQYYGEFTHTDGQPWWPDWYRKDDYNPEIAIRNPVSSPYGVGWSLDLPAISSSLEWGLPEYRTNDELVISYRMQGGGGYRLIPTGDSSYTLEDYPLSDITITELDPNTQNNYRYRVSYKNGRYELFDSKGKIRVIGDKWGNELKFFYYCVFEGSGFPEDGEISFEMAHGALYQVVDSAGRIIEFDYGLDTPNTSIQPYRFNTRIFLREGGLEHELCDLYTSTPDIDEPFQLFSITDGFRSAAQYETTSFSYISEEVYCTDEPLGNKSLARSQKYNTVLNLSTIKYPTGLTSHYSYDKITVNHGQDGAREIFRVAERYETFYNDTVQREKSTYTYTNDYSGYSMRTSDGDAYSDPNDLPAGYRYSVTKTEGELATQTTFDGNQLPILSTVTQTGQTTPTSTTATVYGEQELPVEQTVTTGQVVTVEHFEYNDDGVLTKSWSPRSDGTKSDAHLTENTYGGEFGMLTSRRYHRDSAHEILETYTLTEDERAVSEKTVKENGTLKERTTYTYDIYGNLIGERRYLDNTNYLEYVYSYDDRLASERIRLWNFAGLYLNETRIVGGTDVDGSPIGTVTSAVEYDKYGRKIREIDPLQNATTYTYDYLNRLTTVKDPSISVQRFTYLVSRTDICTTHIVPSSGGSIYTEYHYDQASNLLEVRDQKTGAALHTYTYDTENRLISEKNVQQENTGHEVTYTYDAFDRMTSKTTKNGSTVLAQETWSYDDASTSPYFITTHTIVGDQHAPSIVTKEYKNKYGDLEKIGYVTGGNEYFTTYTYDYLGQKLTEKSAYADQKDLSLDYTTKWDYDYAGNVIREYDADQNYVSYQYDMAGRLIKTADRVANSQTTPYYTTYAYDGLGNVILETVPQTAAQSRTTKRKYDKLGRVTEERILSDVVDGVEQYRTATYTYDWRGNVLTSNQGGATASYTYDNRGQMTQSTTAGVVTNYTYDDFGNCLTVTSGGKTETYTYDLNSINTSYTNRNGVTTTYTLDALGRITRADTTGGTRVLTYTLTGQVHTLSDGTQAIEHRYDGRGYLSFVFDPATLVEQYYSNDVAGNRQIMQINHIIGAAYTYSYGYNNRGLLATVSHLGEETAPLVAYSYDKNGSLTRESKNAVESTFTYNRDGSVSTQQDFNIFNPVFYNRSYTYYPDGNLKTETDPQNVTTAYVYDGKNQLVSETKSTGGSISYTYDVQGNRTQKSVTENGVTAQTTYTYDSQNRLIQQNGNELITYTYDDQGNLLTRSYDVVDPNPDTFTYDGFGQMTSAYVNGITTTYAYRGDGLRKSKTVNNVTTQHVWDGDQIVQDLNGYDVSREYVRGLRLI